MGAWGTGVFENDAALDFCMALDKKESVIQIGYFLTDFLANSDEYIEIDDGQEAILCAEIVAILFSGKSNKEAYPDDLEAWLSGNSEAVTSDLIRDALLAIERCMAEESELLEVWQASPMFSEWAGVVEDIKLRLKSPRP